MNDAHLRPSPIEPTYGNRMTNAEAVMLCRFAKACCPQQTFDQYTPDAWFELLGDLTFDDCKTALTRVAKKQPFVAPAEIRAEVSAVRVKRIEAFNRRFQLTPPARFDGDPKAELEWQRDLLQRVGDGDVMHPDDVEHNGNALERTDMIGQPFRDVAALGQARDPNAERAAERRADREAARKRIAEAKAALKAATPELEPLPNLDESEPA